MNRIHSKLVTALFPNVFNIVTSSIQYINNENSGVNQKEGCYFTILDGRTGELVIAVAIGTFPAEGSEQYLKLALKKSKEIFAKGSDCYTSEEAFETPGAKGAVRVGEYIWGIGGQGSDESEALAICLAYEYSSYAIQLEFQKHLDRLNGSLEIRRNKIVNVLLKYLIQSNCCNKTILK